MLPRGAFYEYVVKQVLHAILTNLHPSHEVEGETIKEVGDTTKSSDMAIIKKKGLYSVLL